MSQEQEYENIYMGKTVLIDGNGKNFAVLFKTTLGMEAAVNLINALSEIVEENGVDSDEKIHLTAFLKESSYGDNEYFGNMKAELVQKPTEAAKPAKKKFAPKGKGKSKASVKNKIEKFLQE